MSAKHSKVKTMIDTLKKSSDPLTYTSLCETAGEKYPQDSASAMLALVEVGLVEAGKDGRLTTYRWVAEAATPKRRSRSKKVTEDAPAAA